MPVPDVKKKMVKHVWTFLAYFVESEYNPTGSDVCHVPYCHRLWS